MSDTPDFSALDAALAEFKAAIVAEQGDGAALLSAIDANRAQPSAANEQAILNAWNAFRPLQIATQRARLDVDEAMLTLEGVARGQHGF